jgi:hypothetical protein
MNRTVAVLCVLTFLLLTSALIARGYMACRRTPQSITEWALSEVALVSEIRVVEEDYHRRHGSYTSEVSSLSLAAHDAIGVRIDDATESTYSARILDTRTGLRCALAVDRLAIRPEDVVVSCGVDPN